METKKLKLKRIECIAEIHGYEEIGLLEQMEMKGGQNKGGSNYVSGVLNALSGVLGGDQDENNNSTNGNGSGNGNNNKNSGNTYQFQVGWGNNWYNPSSTSSSQPASTTSKGYGKDATTTIHPDGSVSITGADSTIVTTTYK